MSTLSIALTGNPNTGKSTIFNELTGARQKIGNWPGVTVEKKVGITTHKDKKITVIDLPGTYSLSANSSEEKIVVDYLKQNKMDVVLNIIDTSCIQRNLFLTLQLLEMKVPLLLDLNMQDEAKRNGISVSKKKLRELLGYPVVKTTGKKSESIKNLLDFIDIINSIESFCLFYL